MKNNDLKRKNVPQIAVLLAAYNGEMWIREQLMAILFQSVDVHIYISVDLSIDATVNIVTEFSEKYPQVKLLPYGQRFGSAAPNFYYLLQNVSVVNYDYIALSDQDDIWLPNKLQKAMEVLEAKEASGYSSNFTALWSDGTKKKVIKNYPQSEYDYLFESPGPGCTFLLKKDLVMSIQEYLRGTVSPRDIDWHDWLIYAFARGRGHKWVIDNNSYIFYRQHSSNQLGVNWGYIAFIKRVKKIVSGYGMNQSLRIIKFLGLTGNKFVATWYKNDEVNYLKLAFSAKKCRRKIMDKILFFLACVIMSIRTMR